MNYLSDTHALLWWFTDSPKISSKAAGVFQRCEAGESIIFIPSIVLAEALTIFEKKRVLFNLKALFRKINESDNFFACCNGLPNSSGNDDSKRNTGNS